ncbi:MAG: HNH endonuclease [Thermoanaerobaculia bacterium]
MSDFFKALLFPQDLHLRGSDPGPFSDYHKYKAHLQREFRKKCVYCREADGVKGAAAFGVDHFQPKSSSPSPGAWDNLFYACNVCNTWKGTTKSTSERFLPNPCSHVMSKHLQYQKDDIESYTRHGAWLAELVHLSQRRSYRRFLLSTLALYLSARSEILQAISELEIRLTAAGGADPEPLREHQESLQDLEQVNSNIERLTGEPINPK